MKDYERKQLLERIERDGATVGVDVPERVEVQGEDLDLAAFVFETRRRDSYPPAERERVDEVVTQLRRERRERLGRLEDDAELSRAEGEELADAIVGIDRALGALEDLEEADIAAETQASEAADRKRWLSFLRKALGQDDADAGPAGR